MNDTVAVLQAPMIEPIQPHGRSMRQAARVFCATALAAAILWLVFPRVVGTTVSDVRASFGAVSRRDAVALVALWAAGLFTHSFVLTGALPGLTRRRALTLNLTGSAIANTLPFGGAAATSMNYTMIRSWGVDAAGFAAFTLVTNVWAMMLKLSMPTLALAVLCLSGGPVSMTMRWTAVGSTAALLLLVALGAGALASRQTAERVFSAAAPTVARLGAMLRRPTDADRVAAALLDCRDAVASVLQQRWQQLTWGTAGYGVLQAALLWACLYSVGGHVSPATVLAGYAVDRVLSLAVITPGGTGFTEAGTAGALVALGGAPAAMAAGVLLYRGFTFALEIPVGGVWLFGWLLQRRRGRHVSPGGGH